MTFDEAVTLLKNAVKESHLDNQRHIDLSLVNASERSKYQEALMTVQVAVKNGEHSEQDLKTRLGL